MKNMIAKCTAIAGFLLVASPVECVAAELIIMVEDAAEPFSRPDGSGYANDVIRAAFSAAGLQVKLDVVPYARCKKDVEDGKVAACASMSWYQGVEAKLVFSDAPLFHVYADVFVDRKSPVRISRMSDFNHGAVIGIVNEYEYPDSLQELHGRGVSFQAAPNDGANLKMLARGRLTAAIVMTNDLEPQAQKPLAAGVDRDVAFAFRSGIQQSYIGFSKKHP